MSQGQVISSLYEYTLPKGDFKKFLHHWQNLHSNDHRKFIDVLNSVRYAMNYPLLKDDEFALFFKVDDVQEWNKFILNNEFQHKMLYTAFNEVGLNIQIPTTIEPKYNFVKKINSIDNKRINEFLLQEQRIHTLFARALNLLMEHL